MAPSVADKPDLTTHTDSPGALSGSTENDINVKHLSDCVAPGDASPEADKGFKLGQFSIDDPRPMKVVVVGGGYSGIVAGIRFLQKIPNLQLTIYEATAGVGGTWFRNKYPGLACDVPAHSYQLTFESNINWSAFYASGPEIRAYLESVVEKYKLRPYFKLQHRLVFAKYSEATGKWMLKIRRQIDSADGTEFEEFEDTADVLFTGLGGLSRWRWPDIEGLEQFQGQVIHSAQWQTREGGDKWEETVRSWGDKRVGVIGLGSSAIQIVPALQPKVAHLVNYAKGKTWISSTFVRDQILQLSGGKDVVNYFFTAEDKEAFKDPEYYKKFRRAVESELNAAHPATMRGHPMQEGARALFKEDMYRRLSKKPWIADHLVPEFGVACRRLTPGPGYLEALCEDNVDFVPSPIKRATATGIETVDGEHKELDVIVCATGFDTSGILEFPFIGRDGVDLADKYKPHPRTYLGVAVDGFPNWFQALGANSGVGAGSLLIILERQVDYAVKATLKLQRERLKSIEIKKEAVDDFDAYLDSYFPTTVFGEKCRSWYKAGKEEGRVVALWPGSCLHAARALTHPRWEDFNYEFSDNVKNRLYWMGDGNTVADKVPDGDRAWYLNDNEIDYPPVPT